MIARSILDTDILSEILKGHNSVVVGRAAQEYGLITFTSVTVYEIVYGFELKGASSQLKRALMWLNQNDSITPVADDYIDAAKIRAKASKLGSILELPDCLIAAVAVRLGRPLVQETHTTSKPSKGLGST